MKLSNEPGTDVSSVRLFRLGFFVQRFSLRNAHANGISLFNPGFLWPILRDFITYLLQGPSH